MVGWISRARLALGIFWRGMRVSPSGHFWNKLRTFLWILKYDLQLGSESGVNVLTHRLKILFNNKNNSLWTTFPQENHKYRLMR